VLRDTLPDSHQSKTSILPPRLQFLHFTIDFTPLRQDTPTLAPTNTLQAKQIKAMQLQMQLLQKESDTKLACKAKEAALKRRRDKELHQAQLTILQAPIAPQGSANRIKLNNKDANKGILSDTAYALMP
jgi:hypothetical protein